MTYEPEIENSSSDGGDVVAAWAVYIIVVFGLAGYALATVFA
jgi:hypothetical protein